MPIWEKARPKPCPFKTQRREFSRKLSAMPGQSSGPRLCPDESVPIRRSSIILVTDIWPSDRRLLPELPPQYWTQPTENASACSTRTVVGDTSRPTSIPSAFSAPRLTLICRSTANSPKRRDASTAGRLVQSSCTSPIRRGGAGFRIGWRALKQLWTHTAKSARSSRSCRTV